MGIHLVLPPKGRDCPNCKREMYWDSQITGLASGLIPSVIGYWSCDFCRTLKDYREDGVNVLKEAMAVYPSKENE